MTLAALTQAVVWITVMGTLLYAVALIASEIRHRLFRRFVRRHERPLSTWRPRHDYGSRVLDDIRREGARR